MKEVDRGTGTTTKTKIQMMNIYLVINYLNNFRFDLFGQLTKDVPIWIENKIFKFGDIKCARFKSFQ